MDDYFYVKAIKQSIGNFFKMKMRVYVLGYTVQVDFEIRFTSGFEYTVVVDYKI